MYIYKYIYLFIFVFIYFNSKIEEKEHCNLKEYIQNLRHIKSRLILIYIECLPQKNRTNHSCKIKKIYIIAHLLTQIDTKDKTLYRNIYRYKETHANIGTQSYIDTHKFLCKNRYTYTKNIYTHTCINILIAKYTY